VTSPARGPVHGYGRPAVPAHAAKRGLSTGAIAGIVGGSLALVLIIVAVVVVVLIYGNNTIRLTATSVAMEPTIRAGQTVSATKVDPGTYRPKRGDIVVFTAPAAWTASDRDQQLVKRVIGLPGERVACCDTQARWTINGKPLSEPYVKPGTATAGEPFDVTVPDGRLWVMGDNRTASTDSRTLFASIFDMRVATIPVSSVVAVVTP
jgi:signal peptidase I